MPTLSHYYRSFPSFIIFSFKVNFHTIFMNLTRIGPTLIFRALSNLTSFSIWNEFFRAQWTTFAFFLISFDIAHCRAGRSSTNIDGIITLWSKTSWLGNKTSRILNSTLRKLPKLELFLVHLRHNLMFV